MWGWLGSLSQQSSNSAFPYSTDEERTRLNDKSIWKLYDGRKQADGTPVSVFVFEKTDAPEDVVKLARSSFVRLKTFRHPNILRYIDGIELETKICVATEAVTPLEDYLSQSGTGVRQHQAISWGIHQIAKGIGFLNMNGNLCHSAICMAGVFVDAGGEWKIGAVDYMHTIGEAQPEPMLPHFKKYQPPGSKIVDGKVKWANDAWGLGCLIWEVFNQPLPQLSALKSVGQIPKKLVPAYCELISANARSRPNPATFIDNCRKPAGFMHNDFVDVNLQLENVQILDASQKEALFGKLKDCLDSFPEAVQRHKILPILLQAFEFGEAGSSVLAPLFKLGKLLETDEYQKKIVPCVVKLFSSTDRGTRINLLQQLDLFVEHLQPNVVNDKIFQHVAMGFNDTVPVMREHTIKSMLLLAPKLSDKIMNGELLRYFAKLQMDEQPGIRTNTTICLGKLSKHLNSSTRQKVLLSAFLRALKDPFPPARLASVRGMLSCSEYFTDEDLAIRLLPAICPVMVDREKSVRDVAFEACAQFVSKLEQASVTRGTAAADEGAEGGETSMASSSIAAAGSAATWAGWAVTSLTKTIYKPDGSVAEGGSDSPSPSTAMSSTADTKPPQPVAAGMSLNKPSKASTQQSAASKTMSHQKKDSDDDNSGWGDDDDDDNWEAIEDSFTPTPSQPPVSSSGSSSLGASKPAAKTSHSSQNKSTTSAAAMTTSSVADDSGAWDDDWGSFDTPSSSAKKPSSTPSSKGASTKNSTLSQKRPGNQQAAGATASSKATESSRSKSSAPAPTQATQGADTVDDSGEWGDAASGWGDDDDDADWGTAIEQSPPKPSSKLGSASSKKNGSSSSSATASKAKKGAMSLQAKPTSNQSTVSSGFVKDDSMPTAASFFSDQPSTVSTASSSSASKASASTTALASSSAAAAKTTASAATAAVFDGGGWGDDDDWGDMGDSTAATAESSKPVAKPSPAKDANPSGSADSSASSADKAALREQRRAEQRKRQEAAKAKRATGGGGAGKSKLGGAMKLA